MALIFVYGTLKRGCSNHPYLAGQEFVGEACTSPGFTLYSLGDYPGMVRSANPSQQVAGELWSVTAACLAKLDELEGVAEQLYARVPISLTPPFDQVSAETYVYLHSLTGRVDIGSVWRE
jgi:gamma-glutamylcyclotransferase (GGCT)/AIG2-like uncharacterized protein YtfP